ncbi:DinB family protein [Streptomyces sp. 7R007]
MGDSDFADLRGTEFERVDMAGARFTSVGLRGAVFRSCELGGVVMRGVEMADASIDGEVRNLVVNGVDVVPFVEAELDRRYPERVKFRPVDADGFREAWDVDERLWEATVARARRLPEEALHASVGGEWSFVQTLRHLVFASQAWVVRCVLGQARPWHPLSLPWDEMSPREGVPHDRDVRAPLAEVLALRSEVMGVVRGVIDGLSDEKLDRRTEPAVGPGWPDEGASFTVRECLLVVLNEEWWHRRFAERDLDALEGRG